MNPARWALQHRTLVLLLLVACLAAGAYSAWQLPSGIYPEVEFPRVAVVVNQGNTPPQLFASHITRPLEQALMTVLGVQRVRSRTIRGGAEINLLFAPNANMWIALQLVQAQVNDARAGLPADVDIRIERVTPVSFPVLSFNMMGPGDPRVLRELADYVVRPTLARVHGVGRIAVEGGDLREIEILIDPMRAAAAHLRVAEIATRVQAALPLVTAGRFDQDRSLVAVMASAEAVDLDDLRSVPIGTDAQGVPLTLGTLATVEEGQEDRLYRVQGPKGATVLLTVARLEGESTPEVTAAVIAAVAALKPYLPAGVVIEPVYDQGLLVTEALASVRDAVLLGIVLCVAVLGAFLRDARAGLVAAVAVPITLVATFACMPWLHQTLNLMSLGGLAVAVGLVVDDAIVIVEAIARHVQRGLSAYEAAMAGTQELAAAVVGTTLTTIIVCLPLAWVSGTVGHFFAALATTLATAVILSMVVALVVVPVAAAAIMRPRARAHEEGSSRLERWYGHVVRRVAPWGGAAVAVCVLSAGFIALALQHVPTGFMPATDEGAFVLDYFAPAGTSLAEMDQVLQRLEDILRRTPEVETFSRRTGAGLDPTATTLVNHGDIMVRLRSGDRRPWEDVADDLRGQIEGNITQLRVEFTQVLQDMLNDLSGTPRPIEVKLFGEDYGVLQPLALSLAPQLEKIDGLVDLYNGVEGASPEWVARIQRDAASRFGLGAADVADGLTDALRGMVVGSMRRHDRLLNIRVRYPDAVRFDPERLRQLPVAYTANGTVSLSQVAHFETDSSPTVLVHEGLQPVVILTADHSGRDLGSVVRDIEAIVQRLPMPQGYRVEIGGQYESQQQTLRNLAVVVLAGLLLVLIVLVGQLRSLRPALAIVCTAPLALLGALATLWATGTPLNASSLMGCVLLIGLAVKNGILLLEVSEALHTDGMAYLDALATAGARRLRPILMTTLATVFGLAPLALGVGAGAQMQRPLALAVMGGLVVSTALSLVILPAIALALRPRA